MLLDSLKAKKASDKRYSTMTSAEKKKYNKESKLFQKIVDTEAGE